MSISAVIPLRYRDCFDASGQPLYQLGGKWLWDITIGQALQSERLDRVIVAYDDDRFMASLSPWEGQVHLCKRPLELSEDEVTNLDVLAFVAAQTADDGSPQDHLILLEITHPLRPVGIIDQVAQAVVDLEADSLVTCRRTHYNVWRRSHDQQMSRIINSGDSARTETFQELLGICSVFRTVFLGTPNPFGEVVDIVPIDKFWATVDVRDEMGLWVAEKYLEMNEISL